MPIFYLIEFRLAKGKKKGTTGVPSRFWGQKFLKTGAEAVDALGFEIKKSQVRTPLGAIKAIGDYVITIGLMTDITADVTVKVVPEA